ncbi:MAG: tetratricopeptide repeat protein [Spirochaetia bacterium]|nr:tetratricopeptide repeat protein [Spirochaetia bacterium]
MQSARTLLLLTLTAAAPLAVAFPVFGQSADQKNDSGGSGTTTSNTGNPAGNPSTDPTGGTGTGGTGASGNTSAGGSGKTGNGDADLTHGEKRAKLFQTVKTRQADIQFRYARELRGSGYLARAKSEFQTFLLVYRDHPKAIDAVLELAEIALKEGDPEEAASYFLKAFNQSPWDERGAGAAIRAARILADQGEADRSASILDEVIRKWPGSKVARMAQVEKDGMRLVPGSSQDSGKAKENGRQEAENRDKNQSEATKEGDSEKGRESIGEGVGEN